jgi:hypothetical protein
MEHFYETCDPEIRKRADDLIEDIKLGRIKKRTPPGFESKFEFSEEIAFENLDLLTKFEVINKMINEAYK